MAKVTIVIEDGIDEDCGEENVTVDVRFDPPVECDDMPTQAQSAGIEILESLKSED